MSNLIPQKSKKEIRREYIYRTLLLFLSFSLATLLLAIILIVPSYIVSEQKSGLIEERLSFLKSYIETKGNQELSTVVRETKEKVDFLGGENSPRVINFLSLINKNKSSSISLNSFSFRELPESDFQASIGGIASNRDSLISFRNNLEREPIFSEVNLPISNLAQGSNIEFSINVKIKEAQNEN